MLTPFRRSYFGRDHDRERVFPTLLVRVLRELANPAAPAQLAGRIQQRGAANHSACSERKFAMTAQPFAAGINRSALHSNSGMFAPLDSVGGRGMSRSSVAVALVFNAALIAVLSIQVHHRIVAERAHDVTLVAPVAKLPEPVRPKFRPAVIPLRTTAAQPDAPIILHRAAEITPAPTVVPVLPHDTAAIPVTAPTPHVVPAAAVPTVRTVAMTTSTVTIQPAGPSVASVNLTRSGSASLGGVPGATTVSLAGPHGVGGGTSVGPAGAVHLPGCFGCQAGNSDRNAIPKPIEASKIPKVEPSDTKPNVAVAQTLVIMSAPTVLFKPKPNYTAEATALRIEGAVKVRIRVSADGAVTVLGIPSGLGHGLDESAVQCAQGIRFKPALDASGQPVDWEGVVTITFQMA